MLLGCWVYAPEFILLIRAGDERAVLGIEAKPVRTSGWFEKEFHLSRFGEPSVDPVIRLIGEIDIAFRVARGPFGELEAIARQLQRSLVSHNSGSLKHFGRFRLVGLYGNRNESDK